MNEKLFNDLIQKYTIDLNRIVLEAEKFAKEYSHSERSKYEIAMICYLSGYQKAHADIVDYHENKFKNNGLWKSSHLYINLKHLCQRLSKNVLEHIKK